MRLSRVLAISLYNELVLVLFFIEKLEEPWQEEELVVGIGIFPDDILEMDLAIPAIRSSIPMSAEIVRF